MSAAVVTMPSERPTPQRRDRAAYIARAALVVVLVGAVLRLTAYLTVPAYAAFQEWLGRGDALREMNAAWNAGDRARALELVPDTLIDELIVHGTPEECARGVEEYAAAGITTTAPMIHAKDEQLRELLRALAPKASSNG